jgi:hypothetical protein
MRNRQHSSASRTSSTLGSLSSWSFVCATWSSRMLKKTGTQRARGSRDRRGRQMDAGGAGVGSSGEQENERLSGGWRSFSYSPLGPPARSAGHPSPRPLRSPHLGDLCVISFLESTNGRFTQVAIEMIPRAITGMRSTTHPRNHTNDDGDDTLMCVIAEDPYQSPTASGNQMQPSGRRQNAKTSKPVRSPAAAKAPMT